VGFLSRGEQVTDVRMLEKIPDINVRIRRREPYAPLNNLTCKELGQNDHLFHMRFESKEGEVIFRFALDFSSERLQFSVFDDIAVVDTGSAESVERIAEVRRFQNDYLGNGQLHIVNADTGALIGRKDEYIPVNMIFDQRRADAQSARLKALAERRREYRLYSDEMAPKMGRYDIKLTLGVSD
jgi:UDP-galactopyranose mutase